MTLTSSAPLTSAQPPGQQPAAGIAPSSGKSALIPLVVDLDGTLTPTNTLVESIVRLLKTSLINVFRLPIWLRNGRAGFKAAVAEKLTFDAANLPYRAELVEYIAVEKDKGRRVFLATAAHQSIADAVAAHLGVFDGVIASDATRNVKGSTKLNAIRERVGDSFVYAGDSVADIPVWKAATAAILVAVSARVARTVRSTTSIEYELRRDTAGLITWLRALRLHQWLKNLLLLVPLLTAFSFTNTGKLGTIALAFLSFCLAASSTYIVNDILDLDSDRNHPRKRRRAFASGEIPIASGLLVAAGALALAFILAVLVSRDFLLVLIVYLVFTSLYSWLLKTYVLIDVLMLSALYTLRIIAGAVAVEIETSSWLLAFSVFIFLSLALVKRCSELVLLSQNGKDEAPGRDYQTRDLIVLWPLGVGAGLCAVVVFGLFISAPETQVRYASPQLLWLVAFALIYWLSRIWIKSARGEMYDDPLVFAVRDGGSRVTVLAMLAATLAAKFTIT